MPCKEMVALQKILVEAGPTETKIIIGWSLDFCQLAASLPVNKFVAWNGNVNKILERGTSTSSELDTLTRWLA